MCWNLRGAVVIGPPLRLHATTGRWGEPSPCWYPPTPIVVSDLMWLKLQLWERFEFSGPAQRTAIAGDTGLARKEMEALWTLCQTGGGLLWQFNGATLDGRDWVRYVAEWAGGDAVGAPWPRFRRYGWWALHVVLPALTVWARLKSRVACLFWKEYQS